MVSDRAVLLEGIEKSYKLYHSPMARFKEALHPCKKKYCENFYALKKIDLEIPKGETWGIIGLNGSGKSTLLKIICGVIQPDCGTLQVSGRIAALLELGSGFNPEYTGRQNVFFSGALADIGRAEMEERFPEIEAFAEIGDFIDQPVKSYSSGMLMRLAFAVAVHVSPDILVVDEALAVGDARFQHKCMKKIKSFKGHSTMLLVTHDMNAVLTLCDQAVWLHEGNLVEVGNPKKIVDRYTQAFCESVALELTSKNEPDNIVNTEKKPELLQPPLPKLENDSTVKFENVATTFGTGHAKISKVAFFSQERGAVDAVYGGEAVSVQIWLDVLKDIKNPIVGFSVKNKLGLEIFGFNSITLQSKITSFLAGDSSLVKFEFVWPKIASDNYAVTIAVADGDMEQFTMHHMIQDIMIIEVLRTEEYNIGLVLVEKVRMDINLL